MAGMIFGEIPAFDTIIESITNIDHRINAVSSVSSGWAQPDRLRGYPKIAVSPKWPTRRFPSLGLELGQNLGKSLGKESRLKGSKTRLGGGRVIESTTT
jgi:hypothetical protein